MTVVPPSTPSLPPEMDAEALAGLGIVRVMAEQFHIGPYRYTRLADAIAQAKRGRIADNDG